MNKFTAAVRRARLRSTGLKALIFATGTLSLLFAGLVPASAAPAYPPPPPVSSASLHTDPVTSSSTPLVTKALASTGADVTLGLYVGAALLLLGALSLYVARRRSA
jgi:LPXTG-motif cell wall-anchored protein